MRKFEIFLIFSVGFLTVLASNLIYAEINPSIDMEKVNALLDNSRYQELLFYTNEILEQNPEEEQTLFFKGLSLYYLDRDFEAISNFDKVLEINPENSEALYNKAKALYSLGKYNEALIWVDKSLSLDPENDSMLSRKGRILYRLDNFEESITYYNKAIELDPSPSKYERLGDSLMKLERYEEALEAYNNAIEIDPSKRHDLLDEVQSAQRWIENPEFGKYSMVVLGIGIILVIVSLVLIFLKQNAKNPSLRKKFEKIGAYIFEFAAIPIIYFVIATIDPEFAIDYGGLVTMVLFFGLVTAIILFEKIRNRSIGRVGSLPKPEK